MRLSTSALLHLKTPKEKPRRPMIEFKALLKWKRLKPVILVVGVLVLVQMGSGLFAYKQ